MQQRKRKPLWERFDAYVDRRGDDECWEWKGAKVLGYGVFTVEKGHLAKAHRLSFERASGALPDGAFVLHSCNNRLCVNPAHLRLGTHGDNMNDLKKSGRARALSAEEVSRMVRLKAAGASIGAMALQFGISRPIVKKTLARASEGDFGGHEPSKVIRVYNRVAKDMIPEMQSLVSAGVAVSEVARKFGIAGRTVRTYCGPSKVPPGQRPRSLQ